MLWNWSHKMRRERGGVGSILTLMGMTTEDMRGLSSPVCEFGIHISESMNSESIFWKA